MVVEMKKKEGGGALLRASSGLVLVWGCPAAGSQAASSIHRRPPSALADFTENCTRSFVSRSNWHPIIAPAMPHILAAKKDVSCRLGGSDLPPFLQPGMR